MKKVLVTATNYSKYCREAKELLESHDIEVIENTLGRPMKLSEIQELISDIDGVVAGGDKWDEPVFKAAKKLKIVARFGVGYDSVDLNKAKEYGIKATNVRSMELSIGVAELTVGLMIGAFRNIPTLNNLIRKGIWERYVGQHLAGRSIGLVGFGSIAQMVAKRLMGFDMNIYAYNRHPDYEKAKELNVTMVSFEEILKNCDVVSLHVPNSKETYHIMGEDQFAMMKDGAYLINTSRGALVDDKALYNALKTNKLQAAAIDVYEQEPAAASNPLFELDNIICTPHSGGETFETIRALSLSSAQAVIDVLEGRDPQNWLNP